MSSEKRSPKYWPTLARTIYRGPVRGRGGHGVGLVGLLLHGGAPAYGWAFTPAQKGHGRSGVFTPAQIETIERLGLGLCVLGGMAYQ